MEQRLLVERVTRILNSLPTRWHRRIDEPREVIFTLDDGTGDVELRFDPQRAVLTAELLIRGRAVAAFLDEPPNAEKSRAWERRFIEWIADQLRTFEQADSRQSRGKNQARFMVSFEPKQLEALRNLATQRRIPIAETIREAVAQYLATHSVR